MTGFAMQRLDPLPDEWNQWSVYLRTQAFHYLLQLAVKAGVIQMT